MNTSIKVLQDRITKLFEEHEKNDINGWFDFKTALILLENGKCVQSEYWSDDTIEMYLHYDVFWIGIGEQYNVSYKEINGQWKLSK